MSDLLKTAAQKILETYYPNIYDDALAEYLLELDKRHTQDQHGGCGGCRHWAFPCVEIIAAERLAKVMLGKP